MLLSYLHFIGHLAAWCVQHLVLCIFKACKITLKRVGQAYTLLPVYPEFNGRHMNVILVDW